MSYDGESSGLCKVNIYINFCNKAFDFSVKKPKSICYSPEVSFGRICELSSHWPFKSKVDNHRNNEMHEYFMTDNLYNMETLSEL